MSALFKHTETLLSKAISDAELESWKNMNKDNDMSRQASSYITELRTELVTLQLLNQVITNQSKHHEKKKVST